MIYFANFNININAINNNAYCYLNVKNTDHSITSLNTGAI